jgi:hypothetical protein
LYLIFFKKNKQKKEKIQKNKTKIKKTNNLKNIIEYNLPSGQKLEEEEEEEEDLCRN